MTLLGAKNASSGASEVNGQVQEYAFQCSGQMLQYIFMSVCERPDCKSSGVNDQIQNFQQHAFQRSFQHCQYFFLCLSLESFIFQYIYTKCKIFAFILGCVTTIPSSMRQYVEHKSVSIKTLLLLHSAHFLTMQVALHSTLLRWFTHSNDVI